MSDPGHTLGSLSWQLRSPSSSSGCRRTSALGIWEPLQPWLAMISLGAGRRRRLRSAPSALRRRRLPCAECVVSDQHIHREAPLEVVAPMAVMAGVTAPTGWPRRRRVAAAVLLAGLVVLIGGTAGWPLSDAPLWTVLTAGTVLISSLALASFVPRSGAGWRPDLGCAPCAIAGLALAVAGPWLAIETAHDGSRAAFALVLSGAALARRLTEPPVCERP